MRTLFAGVLLVGLPTLFGQPQLFEDLGRRAVEAVRAGRFDESLPVYKRMLAMDPSNAAVRFDYALALSRLNRPQESLKVLGVPQQPDALALAAANHRALGDSRAALTSLRRAFTPTPTPAIAYDLGLTLLDLDNHAEAERIFTRCPKDARCQVGMGLVRKATGRNAEAIQSYREAARLAPEDADIHTSLGDLLFADGAYDEAATAYDAALRLDRNNPALLAKSARNLARLERLQEATSNLRDSLRLDPMEPEANLELARLDPDRRRPLLEAAIAADPNSNRGFYQLMQHCSASGDERCVSYTKRSFEHLRAGESKVQVQMEPASVIIESPASERRWGRYQFPALERLADGRLIAFIHTEADSATAYGSPKRVFTSADNGLNWREDSGAQHEAYGLHLKNGQYLRIDTPPSLEEAALALPEAVGSFSMYDTTYQLYAMSNLPRELRLIFFQKFHNGKWERASTELDDLAGLRYTVQGRFPRIWWGDIVKAADGSLIALTYPRIANETPYRFGSACYRSIDNGSTWKMRGQIPNGDFKGTGFTEPALTQLADGTLYAALRTTDGSGILPMYESRSSDLGKTWSKPTVIASNGVMPRLLRLDNGVLVLSSGRPGVQLRFSPSGNGGDWTEPWELIPMKSPRAESDTCSYTSLVPLDRDSFLIAYSWFHKPDPDGNVRKAVFARRIRVTKPQMGIKK